MGSQAYEQHYKNLVINFFDGRTTYDNEHTLRRALPLLDLVSLKPGQHVLDIATGTGIIAIASAQAVGPRGKVLGVDFSTGMLNQAQQKISDLGIQNIELLQSDADYLEFEDKSFDAIFCSSALVYLSNIPKVIKDWYRWLKPGGTAAFSGWSEESYPAPWIIQAGAQHGLSIQNINEPTGTREKCHALLRTAGFQNIEIQSQQLGKFSTVEHLASWDGSWFHPTENPLLKLTSEELRLLITDYRQVLEKNVTEQGLWCESLAFFAAGRKVS